MITRDQFQSLCRRVSALEDYREAGELAQLLGRLAALEQRQNICFGAAETRDAGDPTVTVHYPDGSIFFQRSYSVPFEMEFEGDPGGVGCVRLIRLPDGISALPDGGYVEVMPAEGN